MSISNLILLIGIILGLFLVLSIFYLKFGWFKFFYHNIMGWHMPTEDRHSDGFSMHSTCKYCGKDIMQDSQGNWFTTCD